jgi:hypothetical protein
MSDAALEQRVAALETKLADLMQRVLSPPIEKDWRSTVGMFAGDSLMKAIDEEGRKIREAEREQAQRCPSAGAGV